MRRRLLIDEETERDPPDLLRAERLERESARSRVRPRRGDLGSEEERRRRQVDRVEEDEGRGQRCVDDADAEALDPLEDHPGDERDREQQQRGDDRAGEGVADAEAAGRDEAVEEQDDRGRYDQRGSGANALLDEASVEAEGVERLLDPAEHDGLSEVQEDDDEHERGGTDDQDHDRRACRGRPGDRVRTRIATSRPARSAAIIPVAAHVEDEEADEPESRGGRRELLDLPRHVGARRSRRAGMRRRSPRSPGS